MAKRKKKRKSKKVLMPGKTATRKFDKMWRDIALKNADYCCEYCETTEGLNVHHIISRRNYSTRWYIPNACVLCTTCHMFGDFSAHGDPVNFSLWIVKKRGKRWWSDVMKRKNEIWRNWKFNFEDIHEYLKCGGQS